MFLLPETVARQDGVGAEMEVASKVVRLTLGITRIIAQESLEVSVWGSEDGEHWEPLIAFPQKFYCGTYSLVLDLARYPGVRYLRAQWRMGRWLPEKHAPLFEFYLRADNALLRQVGKVAAYTV
ncbi:MAG TPA: hypothetical protein VLN48_15135 [Bryobacteraceae bacterium]|nr:hypothetical protein [Bryobacteraceae bacterium]